MSDFETGKLVENLVLQKTRVDNLRHVKNLNLWGNDLQDVSLLKEMPNVEVLSLSVNKIASLRDFAYCPKLRELYLRKNDVRDLEEVEYLRDLPCLKVLWLCDNPCAESPIYRQYVVRTLAHLEKLDNIDVTQQERATAARTSDKEMDAMIRRASGGQQQQQPPSRPMPEPVRQQDVVENVRSRWHDAPGGDPMMGGGRMSDQHMQPTPNQPPMPQMMMPPQPQQPPPSQHHPTHSPPQPLQQQQQQPDMLPRSNSRPKPKAATGSKPSSSQKNILTAVLSLLNEMSPESLEIVHQEITERLCQMGER